ncbi:MAG TPA: hypothetical protein VML54_01165, partial [Candidatus Limnocylindrales bacterium]|nr:hypothetical protein [Candidatus Limnocylindrales bacterium]
MSLSTLLKAAASGFVVGVAGMNSSIEGGLIGSDGATMASFTLAGVAMALGSAGLPWQAPTRADPSDSLARRPALRLSIGAGYHAMSDARQAFGLDARSRGTPTPAGSEWRLDLTGPVSRRLDLGVAVGVMNLIGHKEV